MEISKLSLSDYPKAINLLELLNLPCQDLYAENIKLFEVSENNETIAIGGYERYDKEALMRSIAVIPDKQLKGTGSFIVDQLESLAALEGVETFFLLTTTACSFFKKRGYNVIDRDKTPEAIQKSSEFTKYCPESAFCMYKRIKDKYTPIQLSVNQNTILKQIELSDAKAIFAIIDSQRKYLGKWLPFVAHTHSIENTINFIKATIEMPAGLREYVFTIYYNNQFVGIAGLRDTDRINKKTEIGYWISEHMQGKGIVTNCVIKLIDFVFNELELNRIQIKTAIGNNQSSKLPKRIGFNFEGIERDGELYPDGSFKDLEIYSLLKKDNQ